MNREEFMKYAEEEIDAALTAKRNRLLELVRRAWAEGKRSAETERVMEIVRMVAEKATGEPLKPMGKPKEGEP